DEFTRADLAQWAPLRPRCFRARGPRGYGFAPELAAALENSRPELVHVHGLWTFPTLAACRWARRHAQPYLITIHGMLEPWALRHSRWKKVLAGILFEKSAIARAACLHVNTEAERVNIRASGLRNPVGVIPNGVDLPATPAPDPPPWAGRIPNSAQVLLYLGRLHPKKGLPHLLEAWAAARNTAGARARNWELAIAGWDQVGHEAELRAQAATAGIGNSVHFLGPQFGAAQAAAYRHAVAFGLPSFGDGLPMAVLEAWAHGLPVLMTRACNLVEGFAEDAAWPIDPTVRSIAQGLETLFQASADRRREMGRRGLALARARFTWSRVAEQLHGVYRWLLAAGPR